DRLARRESGCRIVDVNQQPGAVRPDSRMRYGGAEHLPAHLTHNIDTDCRARTESQQRTDVLQTPVGPQKTVLGAGLSGGTRYLPGSIDATPLTARNRRQYAQVRDVVQLLT